MRSADDVAIARNIINYGALHLNKLVEQSAWRVGDLWVFTKDEYDQINTIKGLIERYLANSKDDKPLCIAVFGPPGSGKSFAVRQIKSQIISETKSDIILPYSEINLTQLQSQAFVYDAFRDLHREVGIISSSRKSPTIPFVFIDEFDAPQNGVPLGWLNWFLSPMQDGEIGRGEGTLKLKRAVYFFAGGTSDTLAEFSENGSARFKASKGPDFVSRLRGYIDIAGPNNENYPSCRRALVIRHEIEKASTSEKKVSITEELSNLFFNEGRFKHGSRSISAIFGMAINNAVAAGQTVVAREHLPSSHIINIHADQGPLSAKNIGGLIGLSIGADEQLEETGPVVKLTQAIVSDLCSYGATIGYGGKWDRALTGKLLETVSNVRRDGLDKYYRMELYTREDSDANEQSEDICVVPVRTHFYDQGSDEEALHFKKCLAAFRMRWLLTCRCAARVIVGGKIVGYSGRMPGIVEEAMLALAFKQPIYVVGALGGAAELCGELLGLSSVKPGRVLVDLVGMEDTHPQIIEGRFSRRNVFRTASMPMLPLTTYEATSFIAEHAIGGPSWPDNGLSLEENRKLFYEDDPTACVRLILRGLQRRFRSQWNQVR